MRNPRHTPLIEYALIALIGVVLVSFLAYALWPVIEVITSGFGVIGNALAGAK